ncbi:hypothetical protein EI555_004714, partial [Monodon monoceros]
HWNSEKGFIDLSFPWGQFQEETELQPLLKWVEKYPSACARWLWGTKALVLIYDPDYIKVVLGRSVVPSRPSDPVSPTHTHTHLWPREWFARVGGADDKWEELFSLDSHLEVLGHISLMTLDTIM